MPKGSKNRRRKLPPNLPRPARARRGAAPRTLNSAVPTPVDSTAPTGLAEWDKPIDDPPIGPGTEGTINGTITDVQDEAILLNVNGEQAKIHASELMLDIGERSVDRYAVGDLFSAFVFQMEPDLDSGVAQYSVRRAGAYLRKLTELQKGSIVNAIIVHTYNVGIELDVNGVRGNCTGIDTGLPAGQLPHDHFRPSDQIRAFVWSVDHDARYLDLSVRRAAPGYDEALAAFEVGDIATGSVTDIAEDGIWLDVNGGVVGTVPVWELPLADGEAPADRYSIGDQIRAFVWSVDHDVRYLDLSVRRAAPGYDEALAAFEVGDIATGSVTDIAEDGIWLDANSGVIGFAPVSELPLAGGEAPADRYSTSDQIRAFVRSVDHDVRYLGFSVRRAAPGYDEALAAFEVGDIATGSVTDIAEDGIRLDVNGGVVGTVPVWELPLADGEAPADRYSIGDQIRAFVWSVDHDVRYLDLSVRRAVPGYDEALAAFEIGDIVTGSVTHVDPVYLTLDVDGVVGLMGVSELPLAAGEVLTGRYSIGDQIRAFVQSVDHDTRYLGLSVRRAAPGYDEALVAFEVGDIVTGSIINVSEHGIRLDVNGGVVGSVSVWELPLTAGEVLTGRYSIGDQISAFVWSVDHDARQLGLSVRRAAPGYDEALVAFKVGDIATGSITDVSEHGIWLDVDGGVVGLVPVWELPLTAGEAPADRYSIDDQISAFVWSVDHGVRYLDLSVRRAVPGYDEALVAFKVGDIVTGSVTDVDPVELTLDVDGVVGLMGVSELPLTAGEVLAGRYSIGDQIRAFVWSVDHDARYLGLSVRRAAPGYDEALAVFEVGDIVTGSIIDVSEHGIRLDVNGGVVGSVSVWELPLTAGEVLTDHYSIGDQIRAFVRSVDHDVRYLGLSVRRAAPGYDEALVAFKVGDILTGSVIDVSEYGIGLDVDGGVVGFVLVWELPLTAGEAPAGRYSIGDQIRARVSFIHHDARQLGLSVRRAAPGYDEALVAFKDGDIATGSITDVSEHGIWLDVDGGVVGFVPVWELSLADGEVPADSYTIGQRIEARVWDTDRVRGVLFPSVRRLASDFIEASSPVGAPLDAIVQSTLPGGIRVQIAHGDKFIPDYALSLSIGDRPRFEIGQRITVIVVTINDDGKPATLSHRRALVDWEREAKRLVPGMLVQDAQIIPYAALPEGEQRASIDLGPITGFVSENELDRESALELMSHLSNTQHSVVVESFDDDGGYAIVSHKKFDDRWRELVAHFSEGGEIDAEIRTIHRGVTYVDLGSGLLAVMSGDKISMPDESNKTRSEMVGEIIPVRVTSIDDVKCHITVEHRDQEIHQLIIKGESQSLEFKASLRRSPSSGKDDPNASYGVLKSIVGFLNSWDGGTLIVGVDDNGNPIIDEENKTNISAMEIDGYRNEDEMLRSLKDQIKNRIGTSAFELLDISFVHYRDIRVICVDCSPAKEEMWLKGGRSGKSKQEEFFLRTPAATDPLEGRDLVEFVKHRFGDGTRPKEVGSA